MTMIANKLMMMTMTSLALTAGGCVDGNVESTEDVQELPAPLVTATRAGATLNIYELAPGTLAMVATGDLPEGLEGKTPVEVYEAIAAVPAPLALVERQTQIAELQAQHPSDHQGSVSNEARPSRSSISNLTATDFQSQFCNPTGVDFDYCWTNSTGNYSTTFYNIHWIHSHLNAYAGTVTHSLQYRAFAGTWKLLHSDNTVGSAFVSTFTETANGDYEVAVTNATGDAYHLAIHGDF